MVGEAEIEIARRLFEEGWSGDIAESAVPFLTDDIVMRDILGHPEALRGHADIVDFVRPVAGSLRVMPEEYFVNERGVALTWMAYIHIDNDQHGADNKGRWMCGEGMSRLEFSGDKVCLEIDYWKGPQGICDDWKLHLDERRGMAPEQRGARTGA